MKQGDFNFNGDESTSTLSPALGGDGIILYGSNDPEELIARCAEDLQVPLSNPFVKEEFLVQSRAMNSWVKLQLADRLGIFANAQFRFPEETIWMILRAFLGEGPERNPYTKEGMAWKIFDLLPGFLEMEKDIFQSVARYVESGANNDQADPDRMFRLSRQVATLFDSYQTYRPKMIMDWEAGKLPEGADRWQALLWIGLRESFAQESLPELVNKLCRLARQSGKTGCRKGCRFLVSRPFRPFFWMCFNCSEDSGLCASMLFNPHRSCGERWNRTKLLRNGRQGQLNERKVSRHGQWRMMNWVSNLEIH